MNNKTIKILKILIVEDEIQQCKDMKKVLNGLNKTLKDYNIEVNTANHAEAAMQEFRQDWHDIIIMDIVLEGSELDGKEVDGIQLLRRMYLDKNDIEAVIVTGNKYDFETAREAMKYGGKNFLRKPYGNDELRSAVKVLTDKIVLVKENEELLKSVVIALSQALDSRDSYTKYHSAVVSALAKGICKTAFMYNLLIDEEKDWDIKDYLTRLERAAFLHDIGKIGIPAEILLKPDDLSKEEFNLMKSHPLKSVKILQDIKISNEEMDMIKYHHCWYREPEKAAKGYPRRERNKKIPVGTWIIGIADAFDAMTSKRSYQSNMSYTRPMKDIFNEHESNKTKKQIKDEGLQFHPEAIESFFLCDEVLKIIRQKHQQDDLGQKWKTIESAFMGFRRKLGKK
ncbi:MAG: response regulator [bacterium]|nr:response regulator [bacterium]